MAEWPKLQLGANDWHLQATVRLADGFFQLDQLTLTHRGYQSERVGPMHRELLIRAPAVVVILCDLARKELVMVEQFRIGAAMSDLDDRPWMLEWVREFVMTTNLHYKLVIGKCSKRLDSRFLMIPNSCLPIIPVLVAPMS